MSGLHLVCMSPLAEPYGVWLRANDLSANTIRQRVGFLGRIVGDVDPITVTPGELSLWLSQFDGWTRLSYLSAVRSVMEFLTDTGRRVDNPAAGLRRGPTPGVRPYPLDPDEEQLLLGAAQGNTRTWCLLGLRAGLRAHEAAKFAGDDITATRIRVLGKGGKVEFLPTHPDLWAVAQSYPRTGAWFPSHGPTGLIASKTVSARVTRVLTSIGCDGSFHRLRATYGTTLLREGANIKVVQKLMRHGSLSSTEHYLGVAEDELSAAIRTLGGKAA